MPTHDPIPRKAMPEQDRAAVAWKRYWAIMRWMALLAVVAVLLSLIYLESSGPVPIHMIIATAAGVGLTVMVAAALMGLLFVSNRSGHDDEADRGGRDDER